MSCPNPGESSPTLFPQYLNEVTEFSQLMGGQTIHEPGREPYFRYDVAEVEKTIRTAVAKFLNVYPYRTHQLRRELRQLVRERLKLYFLDEQNGSDRWTKFLSHPNRGGWAFKFAINRLRDWQRASIRQAARDKRIKEQATSGRVIPSNWPPEHERRAPGRCTEDCARCRWDLTFDQHQFQFARRAPSVSEETLDAPEHLGAGLAPAPTEDSQALHEPTLISRIPNTPPDTSTEVLTGRRGRIVEAVITKELSPEDADRFWKYVDTRGEVRHSNAETQWFCRTKTKLMPKIRKALDDDPWTNV